jgi:hypothetical protein
MGSAKTSILGWSWHCLTLCRETEEEVAPRMEAREPSKWKEQHHTGNEELLAQSSLSRSPHYSAVDLILLLESWSEGESVRTTQVALACSLPETPCGDS